MSNKRIYEIAKETDLKSKDVQERLEQMGIAVKSASSSITGDQYEAFRQRYSKLFEGGTAAVPTPVTGKERVIAVVRDDEAQTKEKITEKRVSRTVIRRRSRVEDIPEAERKSTEEQAAEVAAQDEPDTTEAGAESPAAEAESPLLKVVEPQKSEFTPRVEAAPSEPSQLLDPDAVPATKPVPVKPRDEADRVERKVAKTERRVLKERLAENDWRETKRMLAKRREFEDVELYTPGPRPEGGGRRPRRRRAGGMKKSSSPSTQPGKKKPIRLEDSITLMEMASAMGVKSGELVGKLMEVGVMVTANQAVDAETAGILAEEYGYEVERTGIQEEEVLRADSDTPEELQPRPPVVTIMGHVDHGKTSLLDKIREARVAEGEAGGITQHIGAYHVDTAKGPVTFLDTPGHEAFTTMRARGAGVTDVVVLVVAADDGVKPQTIEAINHAKAAGVPIVVAVNKIDKPGAKPEQVRQQLTEHELVAEEWGGDTLFVEVSAKTGQGIDNLLETVALQSELLELKANPDKPAQGVIVEARLEKGRGPVATVLIKGGTLRRGDAIVAGQHYGRVRAMTDDRGKEIEAIGPGMPVEILGLSGVPQAGDPFDSATDEKLAKQVAGKRAHKLRESEMAASSKVSLEELFQKIEEGEAKELAVIIKADVQGSVEAVSEALQNLATERCKLKIIHEAAGGIAESDVMLASASNAIVIGFNVRPDRTAQEVAEQQRVQIKTYSVIYELVDDVRAAMVGLLDPEYREKVIGHVEVREIFNVSRIGRVGGCYVQDGKVTRSSRVRVTRDGTVVYEGQLASLKRFKDDAREVTAGFECGLSITDFNDIKAGDVLEVYEMEEIAVSLDSPRRKEGPAAPSPPAAQ